MARRDEAEEGLGSSTGLNAFESRLVNVLALMLINERSQTDAIALLDRAGFKYTEIAQLVGTTPETVRVTLYQQKKGRPGKRRNRRR